MPPTSNHATTRRAVLAACGTALLAGCTGQGDDGTATDRDASTPQPTDDAFGGAGSGSTETPGTPSSGTTDERSPTPGTPGEGSPTPPTTGEPGTETPPPTTTLTPASVPDVAGEWSHPERDAGRTRYAPEATGPSSTPGLGWRVDGSRNVGFAVGGNRLFLVRDEACLALDATSGETVWEVSLPATDLPATENVGSAPGPVYAGETVFVAAGQELRALAPGDGSERWRTAFPGGPVLDLAVAGDRAYVGTGEGEDGESGHLAAVATADGSEQWRVAADGVRQPAGTLASAVAVAGDTVAGISAVTDGSYTVNFAVERADGSVRWARTGRNHGRALTVAGDRVYTGGFQGYVDARDAASGERDWQVNAGPPVDTVAVGDERVTVSSTPVSGRRVSAFSASGDGQWTTEGTGVLAVADAVYVAGETATRALDPADGSERWSLPRPSAATPVGLAVVDGVLFEATESAVRALAAP